METSSKGLDNADTCSSAGCEPRKPDLSIRERAALLNQRELRLTILGASAAERCSQPASTKQASGREAQVE
jgi:hypothetical protein